MFLLNELIQPESKNLDINEFICFYDLNHDFELNKGDLVYFDDYDTINLFRFFQILKYHGDSYSDFINFNTLFEISRSIFDYINCVGEIKKITKKKISFKKGTKTKVKYFVQIMFPDGKLLEFNNIKYLRLYPKT